MRQKITMAVYAPWKSYHLLAISHAVNQSFVLAAKVSSFASCLLGLKPVVTHYSRHLSAYGKVTRVCVYLLLGVEEVK